jgi:hypothetical protein
MVVSRTRTQTRFVVLPPARQVGLKPFQNISIDTLHYVELVSEMQRFRGQVYLKDGAIRASDLTPDGRHKVAVDERSWHVLSLDSKDRVCACLRYLDETYADGFEDLWVRQSAISRAPRVGKKFRRAVENGLYHARATGMRFGEVGGWAVAEHHRNTLEPLRIILATYGLLQLLGGCTGVATATFRHESANILQRIGLGAFALEGHELPAYFDPHYGCLMQVLHFDSRFPNPKYQSWVKELAADLTAAPVICRESFKATLQSVLRGFELSAEPVLA